MTIERLIYRKSTNRKQENRLAGRLWVPDQSGKGLRSWKAAELPRQGKTWPDGGFSVYSMKTNKIHDKVRYTSRIRKKSALITLKGSTHLFLLRTTLCALFNKIFSSVPSWVFPHSRKCFFGVLPIWLVL